MTRHSGGAWRWRIGASALMLLACAAAGSTHAADKPQRIVSLNVCVDQLLLLMVSPARIAALTQFATDRDWSNMPAEARGFRRRVAVASLLLLAVDAALVARVNLGHTFWESRRMRRQLARASRLPEACFAIGDAVCGR